MFQTFHFLIEFIMVVCSKVCHKRLDVISVGLFQILDTYVCIHSPVQVVGHFRAVFGITHFVTIYFVGLSKRSVAF